MEYASHDASFSLESADSLIGRPSARSPAPGWGQAAPYESDYCDAGSALESCSGVYGASPPTTAGTSRVAARRADRVDYEPAVALPSRPLKMMHLGPCFLLGGVEQHTMSLAKFLDRRRIDFVKCLVTNRDQLSAQSAASMPIPVEYCAPSAISNAIAGCDVLLCWGGGLHKLLKSSRPCLSVFVAHGESWWTRQTIEESAPVIDHVIAVSERVRERVCLATPATTILNGVDAARLGQTQSRESVRARLGFGPGDFVLGSVSRFTAEKRLGLLIDAVARLPRHFKLLLVGHGARRYELLDRANDLIPGRFAFAAAEDYMGDYYRAMDAFALVSHHEGFGLVIPEAMMCDRPVIATDVGCVGEVIRDRISGLVVEPAAESIAAAARQLQEHPHWAAGLAAEGRAVADARLHACRMAREYEDLLWRLWQAKTASKSGAPA